MIMQKGDRDRKGIKRWRGIERDRDGKGDRNGIIRGMVLSIPIPLWL
jgi:hypothetical protein